MNIGYLDSLPEVENRFGVELDEGEKVVFTAELSVFGTEKDSMLSGMETPYFTMTNKRILADNRVGIWTMDHEEIVSFEKVEKKTLFFFKSVFFTVMLKEPIVYDDGKQSLMGFHFYFKDKDMPKIEEIVAKAFQSRGQ